jgi:hypothetical protein
VRRKREAVLKTQVHGVKFFVSLLLLINCGGSGVVNAQQPESAVKPEAIMAIDFSLAKDNLDQFGITLPIEQIVSRVAKNLSEWRYPVKAAGSYTHKLEVRLGKISRQSSPVGFSFSSGNSDPRSGDFQKANVLPISCRLSTIGNNNVLGEQQTTVGSQPLQKELGASKLAEKLSDDISTVCFNVLDDLKLPTMGSSITTEEVKPTWIPNVRIEVKEIPALDKSAKSAVQPIESNSESRKQIIIQNQGSPLIINFGHERQ